MRNSLKINELCKIKWNFSLRYQIKGIFIPNSVTAPLLITIGNYYYGNMKIWNNE